MYAPRITPVQRMRSSGSTATASSTSTGGGGGSRSSRRRSSSGHHGGSTNRRSRSISSKPNNISHSPTTPSRRSTWNVGSPSGQVNMSGDYQVLQSTVEKDRMALQESRVRLAASLNQLGEHHVRQKEYDDAMDAFTEALKEKRSVFWHVTTTSQSTTEDQNSTVHSRSVGSINSSIHSSSLLSGFGGIGNSSLGPTSSGAGGKYNNSDEDESTTFSNKDPAGFDRMAHTQASNTSTQESAIDELIATLRNMGNVHSLRGEQDEAMRYYTEVTTLRAKKAAMMAAVSTDSTADNKSFLSGLANDENSALMSEINEDVKALDDLFQSISFRNNVNTSSQPPAGATTKPAGGYKSEKGLSIEVSTTSTGTSPEKRKSPKHPSSNKKRRSNLHVSTDADAVIENEPFHRSTSPTLGTNQYHQQKIYKDEQASAFTFSAPPSPSSSGNEASEAMDMYRAALDNYAGSPEKLNQHKEMLNSLTLRCDLLNEQRRHSPRHHHRGHLDNQDLISNNEASSKAADLELALEIYQYVLSARQDGQRGLSSVLKGSTSSNNLLVAPLSPSSSSCSSDKSTASLEDPVLSSTGLVEPTSSSSQQDKHQQQVAASHIASTLICMGSIYYKLGNRVEELKKYKEAKRVYRKAFGEEHVFVAGTRKNIGMVLAERGEYEEAMRQFENAMKIYVAVHKKEQEGRQTDDPTLSSSEDGENPVIGEDAIEMNRDEDDDVDDSILASSEADLDITGVVNRDVASAISCMGNVKNRTGELDGALEKYMQALQIYKSIYQTARHASPSTAVITEALRDVTSTLKVIGMVHSKKGDLDTAMGFFQEAMMLLREGGGDTTTTSPSNGSPTPFFPGGMDDPSASCIRETMASVLTRIASIHLKKGDLEAAMAHYREAYDMTIRNRGTTNHAEVAGILHYIGGIYHKQANYDEAMACYQESIRIYHATLGPGNPTVAGTLVMVGSIHYKRRNLDSAMMFYREALRLNRDAYGMHHPDVAPILKSIGTILTKKGDYQDAYDVFRDVLSIKCTVHGTDHPEVASAYKSLGNVHYKLGDLADAERQYRHALSIYRRCKGEDHADTVAAKTTIEHLRYWMRERDQQREIERRQSQHQSSHGSDSTREI